MVTLYDMTQREQQMPPYVTKNVSGCPGHMGQMKRVQFPINTRFKLTKESDICGRTLHKIAKEETVWEEDEGVFSQVLSNQYSESPRFICIHPDPGFNII